MNALLWQTDYLLVQMLGSGIQDTYIGQIGWRSNEEDGPEIEAVKEDYNDSEAQFISGKHEPAEPPTEKPSF